MRGIFGEKRRLPTRQTNELAEPRGGERRMFARRLALASVLALAGYASAQEPTPNIQSLLDAAQGLTGARARLHAYIGVTAAAHKAGDIYGEAEGEFFAGKAAESLFDWKDAISFLTRAAKHYQAAGATADLAVALHEIGRAFDSSGDRWKAIGFFDMALVVERKNGDPAAEGSTLLAIGQVYDELGDRQRALGGFYGRG